jgi:Transcriptional regulators
MKKRHNEIYIDLLKKYHISSNELEILLYLYNNPDFNTAKDVVEKRGIIKSHVSMSIEKLIKKDFIQAIQDDNDKRKYHLIILDNALPVIEEGLKIRNQFYQMLLKDVSKEEKETFNHVIQKIYQNVMEGK